MNIRTRLLIYCAVGIPIPLAVWIMDRDLSALWFFLFVALLAIGYEVILKIKNRK